ncbi:MAG: transposase domain-containing protein [Streptosporangiaceae bacterium]
MSRAASSTRGHKYDRVLSAKMTMVCVLVGCLFPGDGYDQVLARAFGLTGLRLKPGTRVPAGIAFSRTRKLLGEQVMAKAFELDASRPDAELGITATCKGMEVTVLDCRAWLAASFATFERHARRSACHCAVDAW